MRIAMLAVATILGLVVAALIAGPFGEKRTFECNDALGCVDVAAGASVRLGVIQALSGKVAVLGSEQMRGLELALAQRGDRQIGRAHV